MNQQNQVNNNHFYIRIMLLTIVKGINSEFNNYMLYQQNQNYLLPQIYQPNNSEFHQIPTGYTSTLYFNKN